MDITVGLCRAFNVTHRMSAKQRLTAGLYLGGLIVFFFLKAHVGRVYFFHFGGAAWVILLSYCFGMMSGFSKRGIDDSGGQSRNQTAALWALGVAVLGVCYLSRLVGAPEAVTGAVIVTAFALFSLGKSK